MVIAGILIGLVLGATGAWLAVRAHYAAKLGMLEDARGSLEGTMRTLAADALASSSESFLALAKSQLEQLQEKTTHDLDQRKQAVEHLVAPIKESLSKVDGKLQQLEVARTRAYSELSTQVRQLAEGQKDLRSETGNLVSALRDRPNVRGRWGEIQLRRVVEMAGMLEHCDFLEQQWGEGEDGRTRPDLVVKLPGGRQIVVDSKAPLTAYLDAHDAADAEARAAHLKRHAQLVRFHMTALGRKAYWETFSPSPELVVMFLPGEMLYSAALQSDPELIEAGANERVLIATPTTLIALLRAVALGWREEALARNAEEVAELGKQLYERIGKLASHWTDVGSKLEKTVAAYNASVGTLEGRVLVTARRFKELGVATEGGEIEAPEPVDTVPRALQAPELVTSGPTASMERIARIG
jgi:DNA recombination protein RmuC